LKLTFALIDQKKEFIKMKRITVILFAGLVIQLHLFAQQLPMPRNIAQAFKNETRSPDGKPGKNYWQNYGKYNISLNITPKTRRVDGTEEIIYTNNSPETIESPIIRLTMNTHRPEAAREQDTTADYLSSGIIIDEYKENGQVKEWKNGVSTRQRVKLTAKLAPKQSVTLSFRWHYILSAQSGREGSLDESSFFIAYFYPRIAVFDDMDGWDTALFTEGHEFYNDFNDYTFEVNVPKNFVVWATGDLLNPNEVLQPEFADRFKQSLTTDKIINIATLAELNAGKVTAQTETVKWKWKAENVPDIALATSDHYIWDGSSVVVDNVTKRRASVQAAYNVEAKDFQKMVEFAKHALDWTSNNYPGIPYPYQKTTVVRGVADMEYPMMVNDSSQENLNFTRFIVEHEILHTWFPFYMGINEQRYGFMDEGWTTAFENLIGKHDLGDEAADGLFKAFRVEGWINNPAADSDLPIITPGDSATGEGFGNNQYGKAALGYLAIKDMLGDAEFKKCLHEFMNRWNGKHPTPWDMFNTFNNVSKKNMNWFFNNWFMSNGYIDLKLAKAEPTKTMYVLQVENVGGFAAPFDVKVVYQDGSKAAFHQTSNVWSENQKVANISFVAGKPIKSITLDGGIFMDANPADNVWMKP
jgi:Peptidase family M1 domain